MRPQPSSYARANQLGFLHQFNSKIYQINKQRKIIGLAAQPYSTRIPTSAALQEASQILKETQDEVHEKYLIYDECMAMIEDYCRKLEIEEWKDEGPLDFSDAHMAKIFEVIGRLKVNYSRNIKILKELEDALGYEYFITDIDHSKDISFLNHHKREGRPSTLKGMVNEINKIRAIRGRPKYPALTIGEINFH